MHQMSFLEKLAKKRQPKEPTPLVVLLHLILIFGKDKRTPDAFWTVPYYLIEWLKPISRPEAIEERALSVFEGNALTHSISRITNIPESIIVDTIRRLE